MDISERKKKILQAIVDAYIETAEPVGSKNLAARSGLPLSSATFRNEMAELKEYGLLEQPHTSAGSIPSQLGFRTYVDTLMENYRLSLAEMQRMNSLMQRRISELEQFLAQASRAISEMTHYTAVTSTPLADGAKIRRVELLPVDPRSFVLVMVLQSGIIKNKICRTDVPVPGEALARFSALLNERITGIPLELIRLSTILDIQNEMGEYRDIVSPILAYIGETMRELPEPEVMVEGEEKLFDFPEFRDIDAARTMFSFLQDKNELRRLIEPAMRESGVSIRIGSENKPVQMKNSSIVLGNYKVGGRVVGAIGIIGPVRMDYKKVVSQIEYFTSQITKLLEESFSDGQDNES